MADQLSFSEPKDEEPRESTRRLKLVIAYDGTGFHGFAAQPGVATVGGSLVGAIEKVAGHEVELTCAGRTDSGVHARGQVIHVDIRAGVEPGMLLKSLNRMLSPAIVVRSCEVAAPGFDARRTALSRRYSYTILNAPIPSPFRARTAWHVEEPLDLHALELAADPLIGEHDFSAFCRRPPDKGPGDPLTRRVIDSSWRETASRQPREDVAPAAYYAGPPESVGDALAGSVPEQGERILTFQITASAFCHQMVRSLVGTMVEMGRGKRHAGEMAAILRSRDRSLAASPAPPYGLVLEEVVYPEGM